MPTLGDVLHGSAYPGIYLYTLAASQSGRFPKSVTPDTARSKNFLPILVYIPRPHGPIHAKRRMMFRNTLTASRITSRTSSHTRMPTSSPA